MKELITVSSTWIFNRLLDEPKRLQKEIEDLYEKPKTNWEVLAVALPRFILYQEAVKIAHRLTVEHPIQFTIVNEHDYIIAEKPKNAKAS